MCKHALFQRNYEELRLWEVGLNHLADILGVGQVQSGVYLVQNVDWGWFYFQEGEDKGESQKGPLATRKLRKTVLPIVVETDTNIHSLGDITLINFFDLSHRTR